MKGQKSIATNFFQARYKSTALISHTLPTNWIPDLVNLEGMFLIHTKPLHGNKNMKDHGNFLMRRFIVPYFKKGSQEIHLLFDDPREAAGKSKKVLTDTERCAFR